ncbi:MAG: endonuclease/exonuclease/phosphatase family protein [Bdellovibrionota bacterium]
MLKSFAFIKGFLLISLLGSFAIAQDAGYKVATGANEIKVMSYNAENLFDNDHDAGKNDYEFLPKAHPEKGVCEKDKNPTRKKYCLDTDWTADKLKIKVAQMKKAILASGSLPDVLGLTEVENAAVTKMLATALGYDGFYITNGPDARGIDNVILYKTTKLAPAGFKEQELKNPMFPTRNLSVAHFRIKKSFGHNAILAVYPNHWPSQASPAKSRLIAAEQMLQFLDANERSFKGETYYAVVMGDFNTITTDSPNPINDVVLSPKTGLIDVKPLSDISANPMNGKMPPASYYYGARNDWNELDRIFISENLNDNTGLEVDPTSFRIHAPTFLTKKNDSGMAIPYRYNHRADNPAWAGFSDHFALVVKLKLK